MSTTRKVGPVEYLHSYASLASAIADLAAAQELGGINKSIVDHDAIAIRNALIHSGTMRDAFNQAMRDSAQGGLREQQARYHKETVLGALLRQRIIKAETKRIRLEAELHKKFLSALKSHAGEQADAIRAIIFQSRAEESDQGEMADA